MAYPVIKYNSSTGSNTNPSDCVASSVGTSVTASGSASGTTITFSSSVNLSTCANNGSDWMWCATGTGNIHLFRITAFTGGLSTCTSVTVEPPIEADFSGAAWHVNGTRQSLESDTSNSDLNDWLVGWTAELDGTFIMTTASTMQFGRNVSGQNTADAPAIKVVRSASASSRPVIDVRTNNPLIDVFGGMAVYFEGIKVTSTTGGGAASNIRIQFGGLTFVDCVLDAGVATPSIFLQCQFSNRRMSLINCYVKGGTDYVVYGIDLTHPMHISNCWFDCQGIHGATGALYMSPQSVVVTDTLITEAVGDGFLFEPAPDWAGSDTVMLAKNVTIADCGGDAFDLTVAQNADTNPNAIFQIYNCLMVGNGGYAINTDTEGSGIPDRGYLDYNAFYNNTSGNFNETALSGANDIILTVDPFTSASTRDYSLNNTAGGGAALRDAALYELPDGT